MGSSSSKSAFATSTTSQPRPHSYPSYVESLSGLGLGGRARCEASPPAPPPLPPIGGGGGSTPPSTTPVLAADEKKPAASPAGAGDVAAPPPPPPSSKEEESISAAAKSVSAAPVFPSPGPYEHANLDSRRLVTLDTHDGFRCDINKQLSPYMAVVHSFWLGTSMLPDGRNKTYTFLTQVADEQGFMMARVDPEKMGVDGRIHRAVLGGLALLKLQFNTAAPPGEGEGGGAAAAAQQQQSNDQLSMDVDINGPTWTANLKYGSMGGGNVLGCNYFQSITEKWALGGEGLYVGANRSLLSNYTVKYTSTFGPSNTKDGDGGVDADEDKGASGGGGGTSEQRPSYFFCGNYNAAQSLLSINYRRVVTPRRVTLAAQLECSPASLESQVAFGAEFNLSRSKMGLCVDGGGRIQTTLEAKLGMAPGSPSLTFAAEVDHLKDTMRFGYGINVGG